MPSMKVHVLYHGNLTGDLTWLLLKPHRTLRDRFDRHRQNEWIQSPSHTVLIEHPDGLFLWDTSLSRDSESRVEPEIYDFWPYEEVTEEQYFDSRLHQLGLEFGDISTVILSHLHWDHAGNARSFKNTGARIITSAAEKAGAFGFEGTFNGAHFKPDYESLNIETVSGDVELAEGIHLIQAPGHTWGTMSLMLDLQNTGPMIFTSDAVYLRESYGPPATGAAYVWDSRLWLESVEKIRAIADKTGAKLVFGHDIEQIGSLKLAPDAYYD